MYITDLLAGDLRRKTQQNHPISALQQVLIALRFYASGSFLQVIGDTIGIDKSTVSRLVTNVSLALVAKEQQYINIHGQIACATDRVYLLSAAQSSIK